MRRRVIVTVVGARPQFIKAAPVSKLLRKKAREILVHTGQHYDHAMSGSFFKELGLPLPDHNLGVGSGSHGSQTGRMLEGIERILLKTKPDWVLVYGDTNSTLAGALAASKLHIPLAHVEAGLRSRNRLMPEETNRVLTDHMSDLLFCPTPEAVKNLRKEGLNRGLRLVGDVMHEALLDGMVRSRKSSRILHKLKLKEDSYDLVTVHRAENTDDPRRMAGILSALKALARTRRVVWPLHPRARATLGSSRLSDLLRSGITLIPPATYLDMIRLEAGARAVLTDSGGVQKEAWWLGVPCVTLRDETEWVETLAGGRNVLAGAKTPKILAALKNLPRKNRATFPRRGTAALIVREIAA